MAASKKSGKRKAKKSLIVRISASTSSSRSHKQDRKQKKPLSKSAPAKIQSPAASTKTKKSEKKTSSIKKRLPKAILVDAYRDMLRARLVDLKTILLYKQNKCHFQIGVAGHEAVQVAAGKVFRSGKDWFFPYYRDMALCTSLGMTEEEFFLNALNKDADPNSHGRQMPMHYGHKALNIVSQSSPTGTQFLQAVGCALAIRKLGADEVVYVSSGEGACSQGDFHEAMNWAARDLLPVVFLVQNNEFAISVPVEEQIAGGSVYKLVAGYKNLLRFQVDGTDFEESFQAFQTAHAYALSGKGPALIEASVPRLQSHSISDNQAKYRTEEDMADEQRRDPLRVHSRLLEKRNLLSAKAIEELQVEIQATVDAAAEWAEAQPDPDPKEAASHTFAESPCWPSPCACVNEPAPHDGEVFLVDALNHALDEEMAINDRIYVFGEDVAGGKGGVFTVTAGLTDKYGEERVFNTQLAESAIAGVGIGMALRGLKPVAEIQFGDYIWPAMMQIRNELAMMRYRSAGDWTCPLVLRVPVGGYIHGACYHSQCIEATFSHFPGLIVVFPSNASDAKGLLKSAMRSDDPVLFLEHKGLYRQVYAKGPEGDCDFCTPLGKGRIVKPGSDLSIICWGALVQKSLLAAAELERDGFSVEVLDLRSIVPWDREMVFESVKKTSRVLIAHEDTVFMGFGAEISAQITEECFSFLDAPVARVGMQYAAAVPHSPGLENMILPQTEDIIRAAGKLLEF